MAEAVRAVVVVVVGNCIGAAARIKIVVAFQQCQAEMEGELEDLALRAEQAD